MKSLNKYLAVLSLIFIYSNSYCQETNCDLSEKLIHSQLKIIKKKIKTDANNWVNNNKDSIGLTKSNKPLITTLLYLEDGVNYWNYFDSLLCKKLMCKEEVINFCSKDKFPTYYIRYEFQNSKTSQPSAVEFSYSIEGDLIQILLIKNVWSYDIEVLYQTNIPLIDTVIFSSDNKYVLAFDFKNKIREESNHIWHLYQKGKTEPIKSILKDSNQYYSIDNKILEDSFEIKKIEKINLRKFIQKYKLRNTEIEISNQITYSTSYFKSGTKTLKVRNSDEFETFSEYTLQINYLDGNDTLHTEEITNLSPSDKEEYISGINEILNRNRPQLVFDENDNIKGIYPYYSIVYKSSIGQFFIYSNLYTSIYEGSEEDENWNKPLSEEEIKKNPTQTYIGFSYWGREDYNVVILK